MGKVGVCGSMNMDVFGYVERLPRPGETLTGDRLLYAPGGKGANQAVAAARAGADVAFHAACGRDGFGDRLIEALTQDGIDLSGVVRVDDPTGVALILVERGGENQIVVLPGANRRVDGPAADGDVTVWVTQAEIPPAAAEAVLAAARATGATAIVNPAPAGNLPGDLVARFDIAIVNETELDALGEHRAPTTVLTLGAAGTRVLPDGPILPAFPAAVVDTTGAGDALVGALAAGLAEGLPLDGALRLGMATASLAVEREGCQPAMPRRAEVDRRLAGG
ncbi:MAG TPA: PfkB family carbohydrate kinase [Gaiellales bacterium]|jgi:ribokinase